MQIMQKTRLRNRFLKNLDAEKKKFYNRQRNLCFSFKKRKKYFVDLNENRIIDNKPFW